MIKYTVIITPAAEAEAREAFEYINARAPMNAARWLQGLHQVIARLEIFPGHGRAPESDFLDYDLRQTFFKSHRIIYSVDETTKTIDVHYIRHGARRGVGEPESGGDE